MTTVDDLKPQENIPEVLPDVALLQNPNIIVHFTTTMMMMIFNKDLFIRIEEGHTILKIQTSSIGGVLRILTNTRKGIIILTLQKTKKSYFEDDERYFDRYLSQHKSFNEDDYYGFFFRDKE